MISTLIASDFPIQNSGEIIALTAIVGGLGIAVISIVFGTVSSMVRSSHAEKTRREIAAYIAEGSIGSEEGERMMRVAGTMPKNCG